MRPDQAPPGLLERALQDRARLWRWFWIVLAVVALAEIVLPLVFGGGHPHFGFERFPAWGSVYGLVSCVLIILVSKLIGKLWLARREDYYDS